MTVSTRSTAPRSTPPRAVSLVIERRDVITGSHHRSPRQGLDGKVFQAVTDVEGGEVDAATVFTYHEQDGEIWAEYSGGQIKRGNLVGTRSGDRLDFRYSQLNTAGETSTGHCVSTVEMLPDGRLRLSETWQWESRPGSGTSVVEEVTPRSKA